VVSGYDVRAAVKEQIESLGARFVVLDLDSRPARGQGRLRQSHGRGFLPPPARADGRVLAEQNVVITTAAVPGKKAPILITREMAARMAPGSVIVDIAAERGGNCELTARRNRGGTAASASRAGQSAVPFPTTPARCTPRTSRPF
jgi:H+-translocating NAD(P) transhydrogenase subunit alpha